MKTGHGVIEAVGPITMLVIGSGCNSRTHRQIGLKVIDGMRIVLMIVLRIQETGLLAIMAVRDKRKAVEVFNEFDPDVNLEGYEIFPLCLQRQLETPQAHCLLARWEALETRRSHQQRGNGGAKHPRRILRFSGQSQVRATRSGGGQSTSGWVARATQSLRS